MIFFFFYKIDSYNCIISIKLILCSINVLSESKDYLYFLYSVVS